MSGARLSAADLKPSVTPDRAELASHTFKDSQYPAKSNLRSSSRQGASQVEAPNNVYMDSNTVPQSSTMTKKKGAMNRSVEWKTDQLTRMQSEIDGAGNDQLAAGSEMLVNGENGGMQMKRYGTFA